MVALAWCRRIAVVGMVVATCSPAFADLSAGLKAIERRDFETAVRELSPLAKQGDAEAQYHLGTLYANGDGVPQSYDAAGALFQASAARGQGRAKAAIEFLTAIGALKGGPGSTPAAGPVAASAPAAGAAPASTAPSTPPTPGSDWRLQLATVAGEEAGQAEARRVTRRFQAHLGGIAIASEKYQMPDGSTVYRVLSQPLADASAREACDKIRADSGSCMLVRP